MTFLEFSRQQYIRTFVGYRSHSPMGPMTSLEPINVNISTLRSAMKMVDPSLERELDRESIYESLKLVKSSFRYIFLKPITLGPF